MASIPRALTVAGSDSGGGAGIQADLKTFLVCGVYGLSALTAVTAQNTREVRGVVTLPPDFVAAQIDAVLEDIGADAVKTGMLAEASVIAAVAAALRRHGMKAVVVDPVMVAKAGARLLATDAVATLVSELLPLAEVVTPNWPEAEALTGVEVRDGGGARAAAERLLRLGPRWVCVTGGHDGAAEAVDVLTDGRSWYEFRAPRIETRHTHGTGCTFSAAVAAFRARGFDVPESVRRAKAFVTEAIRQGVPVGGGYGPTGHGTAARAVADPDAVGVVAVPLCRTDGGGEDGRP
ncbi:MAG: bifunctional hydroxymethylpyrimidine kinase/phosphomethylpyrimidine kinase [Clostridia bacterium]|nr:bifunctional hydroxymethylpyrimidine kinase/phosphomethylpyrimidine kinase [Clostridia bacterium]